MNNYDELLNRIKAIRPPLSSYVKNVDLGGKKLFYLDEFYEGLIDQILVHSSSRLNNSLNIQIIEEMKKDRDFRNFICVNIQYKLDQLSKKSIYDQFLEIYSYGIRGKIDLVLVKSFGFLKLDYKDALNQGLDDQQIKYYAELTNNYEKTLPYLSGSKLIDFEKQIKKPFKKYLELIGCPFIESNSLIYFEDQTSQNVQNAFYCMQLHTFFEDYINSLFQSGHTVLPHPIILINPCVRINKDAIPSVPVIDGYVELDGSFLVKGGELIFLECKNSSSVTIEHVTSFIGKVHLIERIYDFRIRKILFSTGSKLHIWRDLENYPDLKDLEIYDSKNFSADYIGVNFN